MAVVETWYRCPVCRHSYETEGKATVCRNRHPIITELWAHGKYKAVRIYDNHASDSRHGINGALKEADLSDFIEERTRQLTALNVKDE